jgi:hypothetical protein
VGWWSDHQKKSPSREDTICTIIGIIIVNIAMLAGWILCWSDQCAPVESDGMWTALGKAVFRFIDFWAAIIVILWVGYFVGWIVIGAASGRAFEGVVQSGSGGMEVRSEDLPDAMKHGTINFINLAVFAFGTEFYLYWYDQSGTYCPGWLSWIGMS